MGYTHHEKIAVSGGIYSYTKGTKDSETAISLQFGVVSIADAATYQVLSANSGKIHVIPGLSADIVITLPTAEAGLVYTFIYSGVAQDAQDWSFDTGADANYFLGGVTGLDDDDGDCTVIYPDGNSNSIVKIDTPNAGSKVELICADGTTWILNAVVVSGTDTHSAFADQ